MRDYFSQRCYLCHMLQDNIAALARQYKNEFIAIRRHLHAHPEMSYQEFETASFIQQKLREWGIPFEVLATTGVVGIIRGT